MFKVTSGYSAGIISRLHRSWCVATVLIAVTLGEAFAQQPGPVLDVLPPGAIGPEVPKDKGYIVKEIRDGLYWVGDGIYNTIFLLHETGVIAVDAPLSIGKKYLSAIADVTSKPITHVIYSHAHTDHIGSADMYPKSAIIIAQEETAKLLTRYRDTRRPLPQVTFTDHYTLEVGGQVLQLDYRGPLHMAGNTFVYAPKQKVLMLVDVVFPGWVPFKDLAVSQDIPEYVRGYDVALTYDFDTYIGGHLTRPGTREDVVIGKEFVTDLKRAARAAMNDRHPHPGQSRSTDPGLRPQHARLHVRRFGKISCGPDPCTATLTPLTARGQKLPPNDVHSGGSLLQHRTPGHPTCAVFRLINITVHNPWYAY